MERTREAKRGSMAAVNEIGLSRRRHRITALLDSPEEEGQMELQETVRSRERDRVHKVDRVRDRDQELMTLRKRSRTERYLERRKHPGVEVDGAGDSSGPSGEETYEDDYEEPSSSMSNHAPRRTVASHRNVRSMSGLLVADEMIGAAVPRRARSASVKRLNEQCNSSPWGFGERQSRKRPSPSPLGGSVDIVSPSSSSVSLRRKMKQLGPKVLVSKASRRPLPSVEDDIEIEVVEALFDLMKQSQSQLPSQNSKKDRRISDNISTEKLDLIGNKDVDTKSVRSHCVSAQIASKASDLPLDVSSTSIASLDVELSTESDLNYGKMSSDALERTGQINVEKGKDSIEPAQESVGRDQIVAVKGGESGSGSADSTVKKAYLASEVVKAKEEAKFEINLMASPPLPSSPDRDGSDIIVPDLRIDLEKPEHENVSSCSNNNSQQRGPMEPNHCLGSDSERQNFGQLNPLPSLVVGTRWAGGFPQPGCMASLKTLFPLDESSRNTALQLAPFTPLQPRLKRCVTHHYIASNIRHHQQQLTKNCIWPAATDPATLHEAKPCSRNPTTAIPNSSLGNSLQGNLPGRHALATCPVLSVKGKNFEVANAVDATMGKQLVPQQTSEQAPAGNLLQSALIFPLGQHQAANMPEQRPGSNKSTTVIGKAASSNSSAGGPALGSLSFPAGAAAVNFKFSNLPTKDASPFMAILQSNAHPYSISTNSGMPPPIKGAQAPVLPLLHASYYPSIFSIPQNQQKQYTYQPQSNPLYQVQQASPTTGTPSSSTSSHKQSKSQKEIVTWTCSHSSFGSEGLQLQQSQKQHVVGSHSSGKSIDGRGSHAHKGSNDQNYGVPFQTINFALVSHGDGNQQHPGSEHRVAVIPPEAIRFSFDSSASTKPAGNFSALPQDTAVVQMLSDVGQLGYQFVPSVQVAQNKNFQVAEKKSIVNSADADGGKKALLTKSVDQSFIFSKLDSSNSSASTVKEVAVDGSAQTRSSLPTPKTRDQSFSSSSNASTAAFSVSAPKSQQQQQQKEIIQLQKQQTQQVQLAGIAQVQAPISNNFPYSFIGYNYLNNNPIFSLVHDNNLVRSSQWKNASIATISQVPSVATNSSLKNFPQQQSRNSQVQPNISSFGSSLDSATLFQGQQFLLNGQPTSCIVGGNSSNSSTATYIYGSGSLKTTLGGSKARTAVVELAPEQTELSNGLSQKSIPICGRDVPSILSTCTSQLSELK